MDITDAPKKLTLSAKGPNLGSNGKETAIYIAEVFFSVTSRFAYLM
jgi:hypothetical protein